MCQPCGNLLCEDCKVSCTLCSDFFCGDGPCSASCLLCDAPFCQQCQDGDEAKQAFRRFKVESRQSPSSALAAESSFTLGDSPVDSLVCHTCCEKALLGALGRKTGLQFK